MGFWQIAFSGLLLLDWVIAGGYITQTHVFLGGYKSKDSKLQSASTYSFWAAFLTWFLIGLFIVIIIAAVVAGAALFGSGVGEVGVAGAGGAAAVEGTVAEGAAVEEAAVPEEESMFSKMFKRSKKAGGAKATSKGKKGKKGKKKGKLSKYGGLLTWILLGTSFILVIITGSLAAAAANDIRTSSNYNPKEKKLIQAYNDAIIAACLCLGAAGFLLIGMIVYAVYRHKQKAQQ